MPKYGEGLNKEIVKAVENGVLPAVFNRDHIRRFAKEQNWDVPDNYVNSALSNASSDIYSPTYTIYFESVGNGYYRVAGNKQSNYFTFPIVDYQEVRKRGHKQQMGIYKPADSDYAHSIITNVGESQPNYEDNLSDDLILTYHGRGKGRDQTLDDYDNKSLSLNYRDQVPVHVFTGAENRYRDWGKWMIIHLGTVLGADGFLKIVFKMTAIDPEHLTGISEQVINNETVRFAQRKISSVERQVRYAPELKRLKDLYQYRCQVDNSHDVIGRNGSKVVVHHLYPVGKDGPLVTEHHSNEIVLCPNCHSLFDDGSLWIDWNDGTTYITGINKGNMKEKKLN